MTVESCAELGKRACEWCSKDFTPKVAKQRFCCDRCRYAFRDRLRFTPSGTAVRRLCAVCGRPFGFIQVTKPFSRCPACRHRRPSDG